MSNRLRLDCKSSYFLTAYRLAGFVIEVLLGRNTYVCASVATPLTKGIIRIISCANGTIGNIVKIRMTSTKSSILTLCEVEVFGMRCK